MRPAATIATLMAMIGVLSGIAPAAVDALAPDACALLTKAEIQKATGRADAMTFPNQPSRGLGGEPVCTIDGGGGLDIELIVYARTVTTPLSIPKGAEALAGVGAGAYLQSSPGNVALFAIKALTGKQALRVGLQSETSVEAMRPIAIALARSALARLE